MEGGQLTTVLSAAPKNKKWAVLYKWSDCLTEIKCVLFTSKALLHNLVLFPQAAEVILLLKSCPVWHFFPLFVSPVIIDKQYPSSAQFSRSVRSDSLQPHGLQHARPPYPSQLPELTQTHVHRVGDAIQSSHPLSSPSPVFNLSQHQGLFQRVGTSHQVTKILELQRQSFQWVFRIDFR